MELMPLLLPIDLSESNATKIAKRITKLLRSDSGEIPTLVSQMNRLTLKKKRNSCRCQSAGSRQSIGNSSSASLAHSNVCRASIQPESQYVGEMNFSFTVIDDDSNTNVDKNFTNLNDFEKETSNRFANGFNFDEQSLISFNSLSKDISFCSYQEDCSQTPASSNSLIPLSSKQEEDRRLQERLKNTTVKKKRKSKKKKHSKLKEERSILDQKPKLTDHQKRNIQECIRTHTRLKHNGISVSLDTVMRYLRDPCTLLAHDQQFVFASIPHAQKSIPS